MSLLSKILAGKQIVKQDESSPPSVTKPSQPTDEVHPGKLAKKRPKTTGSPKQMTDGIQRLFGKKNPKGWTGFHNKFAFDPKKDRAHAKGHPPPVETFETLSMRIQKHIMNLDHREKELQDYLRFRNLSNAEKMATLKKKAESAKKIPVLLVPEPTPPVPETTPPKPQSKWITYQKRFLKLGADSKKDGTTSKLVVKSLELLQEKVDKHLRDLEEDQKKLQEFEFLEDDYLRIGKGQLPDQEMSRRIRMPRKPIQLGKEGGGDASHPALQLRDTDVRRSVRPYSWLIKQCIREGNRRDLEERIQKRLNQKELRPYQKITSGLQNQFMSPQVRELMEEFKEKKRQEHLKMEAMHAEMEIHEMLDPLIEKMRQVGAFEHEVNVKSSEERMSKMLSELKKLDDAYEKLKMREKQDSFETEEPLTTLQLPEVSACSSSQTINISRPADLGLFSKSLAPKSPALRTHEAVRVDDKKPPDIIMSKAVMEAQELHVMVDSLTETLKQAETFKRDKRSREERMAKMFRELKKLDDAYDELKQRENERSSEAEDFQRALQWLESESSSQPTSRPFKHPRKTAVMKRKLGGIKPQKPICSVPIIHLRPGQMEEEPSGKSPPPKSSALRSYETGSAEIKTKPERPDDSVPVSHPKPEYLGSASSLVSESSALRLHEACLTDDKMVPERKTQPQQSARSIPGLYPKRGHSDKSRSPDLPFSVEHWLRDARRRESIKQLEERKQERLRQKVLKVHEKTTAISRLRAMQKKGYRNCEKPFRKLNPDQLLEQWLYSTKR